MRTIPETGKVTLRSIKSICKNIRTMDQIIMSNDENDTHLLKLRIPHKVRSDGIVDVISILKGFEHETDDRFFYISFNEPVQEAKRLVDIAGPWKATKIWINGEEIEGGFSYKLKETIFCTHYDDCNGICKHDLYLGLGIESEEEGSINALSNWFETSEDNDSLDRNRENMWAINSMMSKSIIEIKEDKLIVNKHYLKDYIFGKLNDETKYCSIISKDKIEEVISNLPKTLSVSEKAMRYLYSEYKKEFTGRPAVLSLESSVEESNEEDEYAYEKKQAEIIADEVEKRLRKVLSEFFDKMK